MKFIIREGLASRSQRILLAVSGGPDSMALMHIMNALGPELGVELGVAHLNHGLRPEAGAEEEFAAGQAAALGLPFFSRKVDVRGLSVRNRYSLEEAGRVARYEYFNDLCQSEGYDRVATGHHQGDVAETVLHHLLRGSGVRGLQGIMPLRGNLIRPLLELTKAEIQSCLEERNIPYCCDMSNNEDIYTRNHIRNQLIPFLEENYNPSIVNALSQTAAILRAEAAFLNELLQSRWPELLALETRERLVLKAAALEALPLALRRRAILYALESIGGREKWTMNDVESVLELLGKEGSRKTLDLKSGIRANKDYERLNFFKHLEPVRAYCYPVEIPGEVFVAETGRRYEFFLQSRHDVPLEAEPPLEPGDFLLDFDRLDLEQGLCLRSRRPGDRFIPSGMTGHKKVKDYYIDARVPYRERERIAILASAEGRIWALIGERADAAASPDSATRCRLVVRWRDI